MIAPSTVLQATSVRPDERVPPPPEPAPAPAAAPQPAPNQAANPQGTHRRRRTTLFAAYAALLLAGAAGVVAYDALTAGTVTTDNAYVGADLAAVTPLVAGPVLEVLVQDTQAVRAGDVLVRLDDRDARIALARAEAELAAVERRVRSLVASDGALAARIEAGAADEARAQAAITAARAARDRARTDLRRREALAPSGAISAEELTAARSAYDAAAADLRAAEAARVGAAAAREAAVGSRSTNRALIEDGQVDTNPDVLAARAALAQAQLDLDRTVIRAPLDGIVSRRQVQVGQRVQPGETLMVIVPIASAYVDANFKELQLDDVRPGQRVDLVSDLYGEEVVFRGRVVGFSGGTGAAFAIVPAQNATGNWIKVVQRLPVRIALDPAQLAAHPLRVGLSMTATIHTREGGAT